MNKKLILAGLTMIIAIAAMGRCPYIRKQIIKGKEMVGLGANLGKSASDIKWASCDGIEGLVDVTDVKVIGTFMTDTPLDVKASGTVKGAGVLDTVDVTVKLGFVTIFQENIAYHVELTPGQPFELDFPTTLTFDAPSGSYKATLRFKDTNAKEIQCVLAIFRVQ